MRYAIVLTVFLAGTAAMAAEAPADKAPLYTNDDLERMFGPAPPPMRDPVDKSGPEDWRWVESFLDRQYARIDADRQYDFQERAVRLTEEWAPYSFGYPYGYGMGYAASGAWWGGIHGGAIHHGGGIHGGGIHAGGFHGSGVPGSGMRGGGMRGGGMGGGHK